MARPLRPATAADVDDVADALALLIAARDKLARANAPQALKRVRLAITSTGGALRHARSRAGRTARQNKES